MRRRRLNAQHPVATSGLLAFFPTCFIWGFWVPVPLNPKPFPQKDADPFFPMGIHWAAEPLPH